MKRVLIAIALISVLSGCASISDASFVDSADNTKVNLDPHSNEESYLLGDFDIKNSSGIINKAYEYYNNKGPSYGESYLPYGSNADMNKVTN